MCIVASMSKKEPRTHIGFRVGAAGLAWLEHLAGYHRVDRSEVIRACLAVARRHEAEVVARLEEDQ